MGKVIAFMALLVVSLFGTQLHPVKSYKVHGNINDIVYNGGRLYVGTSEGHVDVLDRKSGKIVREITLSKIKDFMGDTIDSEVFSVDVGKAGILILSQDFDGYSRLDLYENGKLEHLISKKDKLYIVKAKFVTADRVLLGQLSNVYTLYDIKSQKHIWDVQVTTSKFSDFAFDDAKKRAATADESGVMNIISLKDGKTLRHYESVNRDEVFKIDWKKHRIITAGKDKRVGLYRDDSYSTSYKDYGFFIYCVGLSKDAKLGAASINDKNDVAVFDTVSKEDRYQLVGNRSKITSIIFLNDKEVLVAANNNTINLFKLP